MLLLDENISHKVCDLIKEFFPGTIHIKNIGLGNCSDEQIWEYAKKANLSIVSLDKDFVNIAVLKGSPPKVIPLKFGNRNTKELANSLLKNKDVIIEFLTGKAFVQLACLEIN